MDIIPRSAKLVHKRGWKFIFTEKPFSVSVSHLTFSFFLEIIMMKARWSSFLPYRAKLWGCWKNFDHFLIEMKIKIMRSEKKNIRVEFIQAVLMTSESMILQGVIRTAKSYSPSPNGRFYINIFYFPEPCEPFHRPTGESMDVISLLTNVLFPHFKLLNFHRIISFQDLMHTFRALKSFHNWFKVRPKNHLWLLISSDDFCNFSFPYHCIFNKHKQKNTWKLFQPSLS